MGLPYMRKPKKRGREKATLAMKQAKESREQTRFEWEKKDRENGLSQKSYKDKPYKNKKKNYKK